MRVCDFLVLDQDIIFDIHANCIPVCCKEVLQTVKKMADRSLRRSS